MAAIAASIYTSSSTQGFMDSGVLYFARFWNNTKTKQYRIHIRKAGWTGLATEITNLSDSPLILKHVDNDDSNIQGTELVFSFISHKNDFDDYDALSTGTNFEYVLLVYDPSYFEYNEHLWKGFILPSETSRSYFNNYSIYTVTATDFLTRLKDIEFSDVYGVIPKIRYRVTDIIGWCLQKIPFNNYYLPSQSVFYTQCGVTENSISSPSHPLDQIYLNPRVFTKVRNGLIVGDSCYDVLNNILRAFNLRLCGWFKSIADFEPAAPTPDFWLTNVDEVTSNVSYYIIDDSDNYAFRDKTSTVNNSVDISSYTFSRDSELTRKVPLKSLEILQHNYDLGETFHGDDFSDLDNTSIWTKTDLGTITESGGFYSCSIDSTKSTGNFTTTNGYSLSNSQGNKYVSISFWIKSTTSYDGSYALNMEARNSFQVSVSMGMLINGNYIFVNYDEMFKVYPIMGVEYKSPASSVFEIKNGETYKFRIRITTKYARTFTFQIFGLSIKTYFVNNGNTLDNIIYDDLYEGYTESGLTPTRTIELKIGDSNYDRNASAITLGTTDSNVTSSWKRYGKTETKPLWELIMQSYFNRFGGIARQVKIKVYDPEDTIKLSKKIVFDSNTYQIIDIEKDFRSGWCSLFLQQISTSDISLTIIKKVISQTNTSTGSSTGTGASAVLVAAKHNVLSGLADDDHKQYLLRAESIVSLTSGTTLDATHAGKIIECSGTFTVTLPNSMATGMKVDIVNIGTGTITIAASTTLQSDGSKNKLATQYTGASAYHRGSNVWLLVGKITA
jgi:hypothetical protein